jgi:hypothetical protein
MTYLKSPRLFVEVGPNRFSTQSGTKDGKGSVRVHD